MLSFHRRTARGVAGQQGSSLIEVLVSVIIMSVGMLSMLWAVTKSMSFQQTAEFRNMATQLGLDYADRARANVGEYQHYAFRQHYAPGDPIRPAPVDCAAKGVVCTAGQMADYDRVAFRRFVRTMLPGGDMYVESGSGGRLSIWILWQQPHQLGTDPQAGGKGNQALSTSAQCPAGAGRLEATTQCQFLGVRL
ncbi:MAG: type IV pilus modification protein PilV [Lautropia sp.]|nr:type IV pilus modification protein PilV [Lautropia sp.]